LDRLGRRRFFWKSNPLTTGDGSEDAPEDAVEDAHEYSAENAAEYVAEVLQGAAQEPEAVGPTVSVADTSLSEEASFTDVPDSPEDPGPRKIVF